MRLFQFHHRAQFLSCVVVALFGASSSGQSWMIDSTRGSTEPENQSVASRIFSDGITVLEGAGYILAAPIRWDAHNWLDAAGVGGVTVGAALLDDEMLGLVDRNRASFSDDLFGTSVRFGEEPAAVIVSGMYVTGLLIDDEWLRETAVITASALLISGMISRTGKYVIGRARPYTGFGNEEFRMFNGKSEFSSFPSGHTYVAFSVSAVLSARIKNGFATAGLYAVAALSSFSRVYSRHHWFSDIVFSALYASSIARSLVRWHEGDSPQSEATSGLQLIPRFNGISLLWKL